MVARGPAKSNQQTIFPNWFMPTKPIAVWAFMAWIARYHTHGVRRTRHLNAIVANSAARALPSLQGLETATAEHAM